MAHALDVCLFIDRVGSLALVEGRLNFRYAPAWLAQPNALALSISKLDRIWRNASHWCAASRARARRRCCACSTT